MIVAPWGAALAVVEAVMAGEIAADVVAHSLALLADGDENRMRALPGRSSWQPNRALRSKYANYNSRALTVRSGDIRERWPKPRPTPRS